MKHFLQSAFAGAAMLSLTSCGMAFAPQNIREPVTYDIGLPESLEQLSCPIEVRTFHMEGASRYKMVFRGAGNTVYTDEYNRWSMPPGPLLTRYLRLAFSKPKITRENAGWILSGSILSFEADTTKQEAVLCVSYRLCPAGWKTPCFGTLETFRVPMANNYASAFAPAMEQAAALFAKTVCEQIQIRKKHSISANSTQEKTFLSPDTKTSACPHP